MKINWTLNFDRYASSGSLPLHVTSTENYIWEFKCSYLYVEREMSGEKDFGVPKFLFATSSLQKEMSKSWSIKRRWYRFDCQARRLLRSEFEAWPRSLPLAWYFSRRGSLNRSPSSSAPIWQQPSTRSYIIAQLSFMKGSFMSFAIARQNGILSDSHKAWLRCVGSYLYYWRHTRWLRPQWLMNAAMSPTMELRAIH